MTDTYKTEIRRQVRLLSRLTGENADALKALSDDMKARGVTAVYLAGRGSSGCAASYGSYLFPIACGIPAAVIAPSPVSVYGSAVRFPETALVIGVSRSGRAEDVCALIDCARESGAMTAALTCSAESPLAKAAGVVLRTGAEETVFPATGSLTGGMLLLAALAAAYAGDEKLTDSIERLPDRLEEVLDELPEQLDAVLPRYRYLNDAMVLSRGVCLAAAMDGAHKLSTVCGIPSRGMAISDFCHGGVAVVTADTLAIVLAADGSALRDSESAIEKLREIGAETLVLTDSEMLTGGSRETPEEKPEDGEEEEKEQQPVLLGLREKKEPMEEPLPVLSIPLSGDSDLLAPILFEGAMQLITRRLAILRRRDPDSSAVLRNVTVTV